MIGMGLPSISLLLHQVCCLLLIRPHRPLPPCQAPGHERWSLLFHVRSAMKQMIMFQLLARPPSHFHHQSHPQFSSTPLGSSASYVEIFFRTRPAILYWQQAPPAAPQSPSRASFPKPLTFLFRLALSPNVGSTAGFARHRHRYRLCCCKPQA